MLAQFRFYIIPVIACICFLIFLYIGRLTPMKSVTRYFSVATTIILAVILLEIAETFFISPNYTHPTWQRWAISMAAYMLRPALAYILILILQRDKAKASWFYPITALPLAFNAVCLLLSPFCGIVYSFGQNNIFVNGPMRFFPFFIGILYLSVFLILFIKKTRQNDSNEWAVAIPITISIGAAIYLESAYMLLGSLPIACLLGMIFYYIFLYIKSTAMDTLTGAFLRNKFYEDIKCDGFRYFIIYDVNGLKQINDELGHLYGDHALSCLGHCILASLPKKAHLYRIGGDEFAVVYAKAKKADLDVLLATIEDSIDFDILPFGVSYGYSSFEQECDFNDAYKAADEMLYQCKKDYWASHTPDILKKL